MSSHWGSLLLFQVILEVKLYLVLHTMFFNSQVHLEHFSSSFFKLTSLCPRFSFSQGSIGGLFYVNFMIDQFSYLNVTSIGRNLIQVENDCGYACLKIPSCFSYNVATFPDVNGKLLCELLPSDKFNNSDKFNASREFHHIYVAVSLLLIYHNSLVLRGNLRATLVDLLLYQVSKVSICKRTTSWLFAGKILKLLTVDSGLKGSFLTLNIYHLPMVRHT